MSRSNGNGAQARRSVIVVGGGLAGLASATVLAEQGIDVTVVERERYLGGRAGAWTDRLADGTEFQMERGFHAFFRQYYNLRALIRRVDPHLRCLEPQVDYPVLGPHGSIQTFAGLPRTPPLNVVELVRRTPTLGLRDILRVPTGKAFSMLSFGEHTYERWDRVSAKEYLDSLGFPEEARRMLFEVFAHSFFNPEDRFSAAELLMQFHFYFLGNREGLIFDTMNRPFSQALFEPLRGYLERRRARFLLGASAKSVSAAGVAAVHLEDGRTLRADGVVLALDTSALRGLVERSTGLGTPAWRSDVAALATTLPFAVWRLWLSRAVEVQRAPFAGSVGVGLLDNISIYEKLEDESRAWAKRTGGSIVELHAYAVPEGMSERAIREDLLAGLHQLYPETRQAQVVEERFLFRQDCPGFAPGSHARRPGVVTPEPSVCLAGDFVRTDVPSALMERAVASGFQAANALLDCADEPVFSVRRRGMLAGLRL